MKIKQANNINVKQNIMARNIKPTYIVEISDKQFKVCAMRENIAVNVKFDTKYNEWAVGYAPRDGWWQTKGEAIEAAKAIINRK